MGFFACSMFTKLNQVWGPSSLCASGRGTASPSPWDATPLHPLLVHAAAVYKHMNLSLISFHEASTEGTVVNTDDEKVFIQRAVACY